MGNHVSTDAVPFTFEDIVVTQHEFSRALGSNSARSSSGRSPRPPSQPTPPPPNVPSVSTSAAGGAGLDAERCNRAMALPTEVLERFEGVDHNIKAFRLFYRPTIAAAAPTATAAASGPHSPSASSPAAAGHAYNDPLQLSAAHAGSRRGSAAGTDRRASSSSGHKQSNRGTGGGADPVTASYVSLEPVVLGTPSVKVRPSDVYLVIHIQRSASGGSASPLGVSPRDERTPRSVVVAAAALGGRQAVEDVEKYGADKAPPWAAHMTELFTPRGLSVAFASDICKPAVTTTTYASAAAAAAGGGGGGGSSSGILPSLASSSRSPPADPMAATALYNTTNTNNANTASFAGELHYSVHLLTGRRAHPLTAAVAVLHALQVERRLLNCPDLVRRLFFNCNLARVPVVGNATSSVAGGERACVDALLAVTRPASIGTLSTEHGGNPDSTANTAHTNINYHTNALGCSTGAASSVSSSAAPGPGQAVSSVYFGHLPLQDTYSRNALLRLIHNVRATMLPTPRLSAGTSTTVSTSARFSPMLTPHSGRQGPPVVAGAGAGGGGGLFHYKTSTLTVPVASQREPQLQGPPTLEIPKLRAANSSGTTAFATGSSAAGGGGGGGRESPRPNTAPGTAAGNGESLSTSTSIPTSSPGKRRASSARTPKVAKSPCRPDSTRGCRATAGQPPTNSTRASHDTPLDAAKTSTAPPSTASSASARDGGERASPALSPAVAQQQLPSLANLRLGEVLRGLQEEGGNPAMAMLPLGAISRGGVSRSSSAKTATVTNRNNTAQGGAGDHHADFESDERRMCEDRILRLKQAAPEATEVLPWLFVGGEEAAKNRAQLLAKGITGVVNTVAFDLPNYHDDVFHYLPLSVCDAPDEPIFSLFPIVNRFIEEEHESARSPGGGGGKVFVHCHQGVSRSCSFVIAYAMWKLGLCYDRAYERVRAARRVCSPNTGFYVNLRLWESQLVRPVFNKAYVFVPYSSTYAFPFSFRLALSFRKNASLAHDDDDASIITPYTQIVEEGGSCVVDTRVFYGFIFGERPATPATKPTPLSSFGFTGRHCDPTVAQRAQEEWIAFLHYSFYQGAKSVSVNDRDEPLHFLPMAALDSYVVSGSGGNALTSALDTTDVVRRVSRCVFSDSSWSAPFTVKEERLEKFDPLLKHKKLMFSFAMHLKDEEKARAGAENRKRAREEENRRNAATTASSASSVKGRAHQTASPPTIDTVPSLPPSSTHLQWSDRTARSLGSTATEGVEEVEGEEMENSHHHNQSDVMPPSGDPHRPPRGGAAATAAAVTVRTVPHAMAHKGPAPPRTEIVLGGGPGTPRAGKANKLNTGVNASATLLSLRLPGTPPQPVQQDPHKGPAPPSKKSKTTTGTSLYSAALPTLVDILVIQYPFTAKDIVTGEDDGAAVLLEDLDPAECYAILVPDTGAGTQGNRAFLWLGDKAAREEKEVWRAFWASLGTQEGPRQGPDQKEEEKGNGAGTHQCTVRVAGKQMLRNVTAEIVLAGEEPDELLLVM